MLHLHLLSYQSCVTVSNLSITVQASVIVILAISCCKISCRSLHSVNTSRLDAITTSTILWQAYKLVAKVQVPDRGNEFYGKKDIRV